MQNKKEEQIIEGYLKSIGLCCMRFSKAKRLQGKTPDCKVYKNNELKFFCEVKTVEAIRIGGNDPIFNKLTDDIHEAMKQFDAVNPKEDYSNVLTFVNQNEEDFYNFADLRDTITGNFLTDTGKNVPIYRKFSEGRIKNEKTRIHLYIWLNLNKQKPHLFFNMINDKHLNNLCSIFNVNLEDLRKYYINA